MELSRFQRYICTKRRIPTWYFARGWRGFIVTYFKWAKGYYKRPIKRFRSWLRYKRES